MGCQTSPCRKSRFRWAPAVALSSVMFLPLDRAKMRVFETSSQPWQTPGISTQRQFSPCFSNLCGESLAPGPLLPVSQSRSCEGRIAASRWDLSGSARRAAPLARGHRASPGRRPPAPPRNPDLASFSCTSVQAWHGQNIDLPGLSVRPS